MFSDKSLLPLTETVHSGSRAFTINEKTCECDWKQIFWIQAAITIAACMSISAGYNKSESILWINFVIIELSIVPLIVIHELGHALAASILDARILNIVIGVGKNIFTFKFFNILVEIHQFPICGKVVFLLKTLEFHRLKYFTIVCAGPLTHVIIAVLLWQASIDSSWHISLGTLAYFKTSLQIANWFLLLVSLFPGGERHIDSNGLVHDENSDGLQLLRIPFMEEREIADRIANVHVYEGWESFKLKEYTQANRSFCAALKINPRLATAYRGRANVYQGLLDFPRAISDFSYAIDLDPENAISYKYRGIGYLTWLRIEDNSDEHCPVKLEQSINDLNTAISLDKTLITPYFGLAIINYYKGDLHQTILNFTSAIDLKPSSDAYYSRAVTLWELNEDRSALTDLDRSIDRIK